MEDKKIGRLESFTYQVQLVKDTAIDADQLSTLRELEVPPAEENERQGPTPRFEFSHLSQSPRTDKS